jgi:hypothetical protein
MTSTPTPAKKGCLSGTGEEEGKAIMDTMPNKRLAWSKDIPTQSGYYWWRDDPEYNSLIVWVSSDGTVLRIGSPETQPAAVIGGQWRGPLRPGGEEEESENWPP